MNKKYSSVNSMPLVTIITVVKNNVYNIKNSILSVLSQDYKYIEYILIDGGSSDGTKDIIINYSENIDYFISEDDNGIYDALNKGIRRSTGDVIGILHSDDVFCGVDVVSSSIGKMIRDGSDLCFSDMIIVDKGVEAVFRNYKASFFKPWMFRIGWMPPHPTTFFSKSIFDEFGLYSNKYKIAGDFDFFVKIFSKKKIRWSYLNRVTVKMTRGGVSNSGFKSTKLIASEINKSLKDNNIWSTPILQVFRYIIRVFEITLPAPKNNCYKNTHVK